MVTGGPLWNMKLLYHEKDMRIINKRCFNVSPYIVLPGHVDTCLHYKSCSCPCGYGKSRCPEIGCCDIKHDWNLQVIGTIVLIQTSCVSVLCVPLLPWSCIILTRHSLASRRRCSSKFLTRVGLWRKYWHQGGKHISMLCKTERRHYQASHSIVLSRASSRAMSALGNQDCRIQPWNVDHPISL